ncbi:MAG TPA: hypothetical protein VOA80_11165 [Thermoanaerobaculia bacterium]|nr:hypothetical protein [Thermoanaerobaculia bacterium]
MSAPSLPAIRALPAIIALQAIIALPAVFAIPAIMAIATVGAMPAAATPYNDNERLQFTGVVSDPAGKPVPGVQVVVEVSRRYLSLRQLRRADKDVRRIGARSNTQGEYSIEWPWDGYFNHFQLLAGVSVRHGKEERLEVLASEDVTERVLAGSPVVSPIVIHDRGVVDRLRDFVASVRSEDERRVYEEMGVPEDVKRVSYAGRQQENEVSWWYFEAGKVYRFRDGRLDQVEHFDPVQRF